MCLCVCVHVVDFNLLQWFCDPLSGVLASPIFVLHSLNGIYPVHDYNSAMTNPQYLKLVQFIQRVEDNFFRTCTSKVHACVESFGFDQWDYCIQSCDSFSYVVLLPGTYFLFRQDEYFAKLADKYQHLMKELHRTCESPTTFILRKGGSPGTRFRLLVHNLAQDY